MPFRAIDMLGRASISFPHFVFPGPGRPRPVSARGFGGASFVAPLLVLCALALDAGCTRRSGVQPVEDTETSGRISIAAAPDAQSLVAEERAAFRATYPEATLDLRPPESSGQVLGALFAGHADVAVAGRELEDEERRMAQKAGIEVEGTGSRRTRSAWSSASRTRCATCRCARCGASGPATRTSGPRSAARTRRSCPCCRRSPRTSRARSRRR